MTKKLYVGNVAVGGGAPVSIQSMCNTKTDDVAATVAQIQKLAAAGCEIIRVAIPDMAAAEAVDRIKEQIDIPLVADMSSIILSEEIDVSKFGIIYAGAQKNMGPAGVTVVIIREDLIGEALPFTPTMLKYSTHAGNGSMYNTPPTYAIYICKLVYQWIKDLGGIKKMQELNEKKAKILYDFLDNSKMFKGTVVPEDRSLMNVPFITGNDELDAKFVAESKAAGFVNLKGHRSVGGMRASIYNAMPVEGVEKLVEFMKKFEEENS